MYHENRIMPTVSIIIPNYNHAPYLEERIQSVLNQTFQDFELIILDDKSSDNSKEIIERYRIHPKVSHIVYNHENSGSTFKQWQKGIGLAVGQWIWIAESDDVAETMFLEELLSKIDTHKNIVVAFCASMTIDKNSTYLGQESWAHDISNRDWGKDFVNDGVDEVKTQMFYKNAIPNASAALFRKSAIPFSVFEEIVKMKFAGDWLFWTKLLEKGTIAYCSRKLNKFRTHGATTRNSKSKKLEEERFAEYFRVLGYIARRHRLSWNCLKHGWILREWVFKRLDKKVSRFFNPNFPMTYNAALIYRFLKEVCYLTVRRARGKDVFRIARCFIANWIRKTASPDHFPDKEHILDINNSVHSKESGNGSGSIPKIIWMYWEAGEIPDYVQKMISRIREQNPHHEFHLVRKKTLKSYLPDLEFQGEMPVANKTDIIRLELLYRYGGIWLDCTIFINGNLQWVHELDQKLEYDLIAYYRDFSTIDYSYPVVESWFLCARPQNSFIKEWLEQLSPLRCLGSKNYYQVIRQRSDYECIKQKIDSPEYLLVYLACQIAMRNHKAFNIYLKRAEDSALYLLEYYKSNYSKINFALCRFNIPANTLPIIKLTSGCRSLVPLFQNAGLIKKYSLMGRILNNQ